MSGTNPNSQNTYSTTYVTAVPVTNTAHNSSQQFPTIVEGFVRPEDDRTGLCRRCGRTFIRAPGVHNAMAQYYNCDSK